VGDGLSCPKCGSNYSQVVKTMKFDNFVRRYRQCHHCGKNWPTTEYSNKPIERTPKPDDDDEIVIIDDDPFDF